MKCRKFNSKFLLSTWICLMLIGLSEGNNAVELQYNETNQFHSEVLTKRPTRLVFSDLETNAVQVTQPIFDSIKGIWHFAIYKHVAYQFTQ